MSAPITLTFGEIMLRLMPQNNAMLTQSLPGLLQATFGGAEANVAFGIANLGGKSRFVTALPDNQITQACLAGLRATGVDTSFVRLVKEGRMGVYFVEAGANQRPSKVVYDRAFSAASLTPFEDYGFEAALDGVERLHISGITPALSETAAAASINLCALAKSKGVKISCDLNFRNKLWNWRKGLDAKTLAREVMPKILENCDLVIGNEEDAHDVLNIKAGNSDVQAGALDLKAYEGVAAEICARFASVQKVAFTLRESVSANHNNWGALLYEKASAKAVLAPMKNGAYEPYKITHIVDRVGGGDAFAAGLLYATDHSDLKTSAEHLEFAVANSCLAHSIVGDYNYAPKSDVLALMKGAGSGRVQR